MHAKEFEASLIGRPNTLKTQTSLFRNWIKPHKIDKNFLPVVFRTCQDAGLKARTIRSIICLAGRYVEFVTGSRPNTRRLLRVANNLEMPPQKRIWSREEAERALETCKNELPELFLPLLLTMHLGLRKGEAIGLKWKDVDFIKGQVEIQRSYEDPTKSGRSRIIPLSTKLEKELYKWYKIGRESYRVFQPMELNYHLRKLCKLAKVPKISWHSLRHFFATSALEAGVSPRLVQEMLGHSHVGITLATYWNLPDEKVELDFLP